MKILSVYIDHDASACVIENGKILYYSMEERLSRIKHDSGCKFIVKDLLNKNFKSFNLIVVSYIQSNNIGNNFNLIKESFEYDNIILDGENHHKHHAYSGFASSGFEEALCFVFDGGGSLTKSTSDKFSNYYFKEIESVFYFNRRLKEEKKVYKHFHLTKNFIGNLINFDDKIDEYIEDNVRVSTNLSVGWKFERFCIDNGFSYFDAGKIMGLAQYKNKINLLKEPYNTEHWISLVNGASDLQKDTQNYVLNLIKEYTEKTGIKNVIISGGYALNCVANYFYLNELPNINLVVDPICFDAGISIGAGYYHSQIFSNHMKNVYIGYKENYNNYNFDTKKYKIHNNVNFNHIVKLLIDQNPIALFQGQSESGQRALGNRSLLFDPRNHNSKDILNLIKKRENYRPFAVSVLLDHVHEWFDIGRLHDSPYMQYAVKSKKNTLDLIPSAIHVDGSSRIQTVSKDQNKILYSIIEKFYNETGIPMILNTSLNLAEEPLVDSLDDAIMTMNNSCMKYIYLPEIKVLIYKN